MIRYLMIAFLLISACARTDSSLLVGVDRSSLVQIVENGGGNLLLAVDGPPFRQSFERYQFRIKVYNNKTKKSYLSSSVDDQDSLDLLQTRNSTKLNIYIKEYSFAPESPIQYEPDPALVRDDSSICTMLHLTDMVTVLRSNVICHRS